MLSSARCRIAAVSARSAGFVARASYSSTIPRLQANVPQANTPLAEVSEAAERSRELQAPNRANTWAASQRPRAEAMSGPRFEQTVMEMQPQPMAAIELIHKQPVRWTKKRVVACDGGGGPLGHPKVFINTDKAEIATCGYCGVPFAHEQHRAYLESLPATSYPLKATGDSAEVNETQRVTEGGLEQR
ncbi:hypothetical protein ASPZODRAFT_135437 [Penicilliopsis zonata CBS 506.65]|uniref:Zinc finger CHCC-type domain-containing protein n=1 Tax=Penicilliopsis zonata CBS 506.65 TaxID=1073090 RepID=A0A1L9S9Z6_9EURO|nr:hypothetical protein ASPZODRAFT_135437 [Penicilliopsis zonata CBS 506.65]OJJ44005.1 hypothetical protein ASPZODRAFT_135437 [Penicilliopsis zonata CBS 506.65]